MIWQWNDLYKAFMVEARWYHNGCAPTLDEYLENAWVSAAGNVALSYAYCINDYVTANDLELFSTGYPDIVRYSSMNFRLYNDLVTSSVSAFRKQSVIAQIKSKMSVLLFGYILLTI
jgi:(-)-alpha-terpineol synthase